MGSNNALHAGERIIGNIPPESNILGNVCGGVGGAAVSHSASGRLHVRMPFHPQFVRVHLISASTEDGETSPRRLPNLLPNEHISYPYFHVVWQSLWLLKYLKVKSRWSVSR